MVAAATAADPFAAARPSLLALAYRMLGSRADAEDAVQDTFVKWQQADRAAIETPAAWLTTACTRRCIDMMRAAHRARVDYVGTWLPEPIETALVAEPEERLASSLGTAFLLLLERLTPKERAAYLLHEIFDMPYADVARTLAIAEPACRKLVSRARGHVGLAQVRHATPLEQQDRLLAAFESAVTEGRAEPLAALLAEDAALRSDGGGKVSALPGVLRGREKVVRFVLRVLHRAGRASQWTVASINGARGFVVRSGGTVVSTVSFAYDAEGLVTDVYIMRNPDKLARLGAPATGDAATAPAAGVGGRSDR